MSRAEITRGKEMAFTKITNVELNSRGATTLPNVPTIGATALKQEFDAPAKQIVAPKFNNLIDELQASTASADLGASAPTGRTGTSVQGVLNSLSADLGNVEASSHSHPNKAVIDKFADDGTGLTYDGSPISGAVDSVNGQTGEVVLSATDVGALPNSTPIPTKTSDLTNDSGFVTSSDLPTKTSDLTNDSNFVADASYVHTDNNYDATAKGIVDGVTAAIASKSTVTYNQTYSQAGQKLGEITIDGVKTDIIGPTGGGGGGGGAVDSVNGQTGQVVLDAADVGALPDTTPIPSKVSDLTNDSGFQTASDVSSAISGKADSSDVSAIQAVIPSGATSGNKLTTASDVSTAISGKADTSSLGDLAYIDIDGLSSTKVLQGDGQWVTPSTGGHDMIPIYDSQTGLTDLETIEALNSGTAEKVANAYSIKRWSNCEAKEVLTTAGKDDTGIGVWNDDWESTSVRTGWLWSSELYQVLEDGNGNTVLDIDISPVFDIGKSETVGLLSYRIDDNYPRTIDGVTVNGGCVAFKFTGAIKSASGVKVGLKLVHQRTEVNDGTILT